MVYCCTFCKFADLSYRDPYVFCEFLHTPVRYDFKCDRFISFLDDFSLLTVDNFIEVYNFPHNTEVTEL